MTSSDCPENNLNEENHNLTDYVFSTDEAHFIEVIPFLGYVAYFAILQIPRSTSERRKMNCCITQIGQFQCMKVAFKCTNKYSYMFEKNFSRWKWIAQSLNKKNENKQPLTATSPTLQKTYVG